MKVGEFFIDMGINATPGATTLKDFLGTMGGLKMSTLSAVGALGTIGMFLSNTVDMTSNASVAFQKFGNQTGLSTQELQNWQIAAKQANVDANTIAGGIFNLQMNLAALARGEGNISPFQKLLVSPEGGAFKVLDALRERRKFMDPAQFTGLISQLGLSPEWVNVLKLSNEEYKKFMETAKGLSPQAISDVLKMTESWNKLGLKIRDARLQIGSFLANPIKFELDYFIKNFDSSSLSSSLLTGASMPFLPFAQSLNKLLHDYTPLGYAYDKSGLDGGKRVTNLHMNVYGDTHDKKFAEDVASMVEQTEAQMPLPESSIQ